MISIDFIDIFHSASGFLVSERPISTTAQIDTKPLDEDNIDHASLSKEYSGGQLEVSPVGRIQILVHDLKMYSFSELRNATRDFRLHLRLGAGEFGEVFKGCINTKTDSLYVVDAPLKIAVKRLYHFKIQHRVNEKFLDLTILSAFNHPNLVKLLGYCFKDQKLFHVYEFVENGSLDGHLFTRSNSNWNSRSPLFLRRTQNQVDNRPLRLHNVLLDMEFNAKLSDFEAAKLVHGNSYSSYTGHIDTLQVKGNVHAYGVVLVQILTGQHIEPKGRV
ncbi:hypothetical protein L1987_45635 [Smallanthus sonchifolius]|uniref:Uncharacterized protein n=1 Tax=Smallanthus sonchifolius TaxID=185202 RepID=A0ACB9FXK7_9ASTR|nr:hypothetical protein L1987_45635 [Smallanthus sonchifolius]